MSENQRRHAKIFSAIKELDRFNLDTLLERLQLQEPFLEGRRVDAVLGDMQVDKLLKKKDGVYEMTPHGRQVLLAVEIQTPLEEPAPSFTTEEFLAELGQVTGKTPAKGLLGRPVKQVKTFEAPTSSVIELPQELELKIPQAPVKPLPERKKRPEPKQWNCEEKPVPKFPNTHQEAMVNFKWNFESEPADTVGKLAELVLNQRVLLQKQDEVLRNLFKVLQDYVQP